MTTSRRNFLIKSAAAAAGFPYAAAAIAQDFDTAPIPIPSPGRPEKIGLYLFSKVLQWLDYEAMATETLRAGFDGIELTVRPGGHVLPEKVTEDLPRAVEIFRNAGLKEIMICTAITDPADRFTEPILKTASSLGIRHYRMGYFYYKEGVAIQDEIKRIKESFVSLANLNERYQIKGSFQNHSGLYFGAPVWDLAWVLQEVRSAWLGCQYDVRHAIVEGAYSWPFGLELIKPFINTIAIKDFVWAKSDDGHWRPHNVPIGKGMVDFSKYFNFLQDNNLRRPISLHYEYSLGGAESGKKSIRMPAQEVFRHIRQDVVAIRKLLDQHQLL